MSNDLVNRDKRGERRQQVVFETQCDDLLPVLGAALSTSEIRDPGDAGPGPEIVQGAVVAVGGRSGCAGAANERSG